MRLIFALILPALFAFTFSTLKKKNYPVDYFRSPVGHDMLLSGTFGELRPNHFHAGIDIKGKIGEPVYAAGEGFVSRIKIRKGGYGNVLYIDHPNGFTSVYAHLESFAPEIADYVKTAQYQQKSFEIELFPQEGRFIFGKGTEIGKMGVSGRSFGPHLHFEIRDSRSEKPINPLLFGLKIRDEKAPKLHQLKVYSLNKNKETTHEQINKLIKEEGAYRTNEDTLLIGARSVGFGLKVYDHMNGASNWNGIYTLSVYEEERLIYEFEMESFAFDETRYINAHLDYEAQITQKSYFNRCYSLPGNALSIYNQKSNDGVVTLFEDKAKKITMVAGDIEGNQAQLVFWVRRDPRIDNNSKNAVYNYLLPFDEENVISNKWLYLHLPKGALYEDVYMKYETSREKSDGIYMDVHHIHNFKTPVHKYFTLGIRPPVAPPSYLKEKAFIGYCNTNNQTVNCGGEWKNGMLFATVRDFGDYSIRIDDMPPVLKPRTFKSDMRGYKKMTFSVTDNVKTARNVEGLKYIATVDGKWILMEFDEKKNLLTHQFDERISPGSHIFRLEVIDSRGNSSVFEKMFRR